MKIGKHLYVRNYMFGSRPKFYKPYWALNCFTGWAFLRLGHLQLTWRE